MHTEHTIFITAPPEVVWEVTRNVEQWPTWTSTVQSVERMSPGPFRLGSRARIKQPLQPEAEWVVTEFAAGRRFAWTTRHPGLHLTGIHEIEPHGDGTRNHLRVEATGVLGALFWPLLRLAMQRALTDENRGLKAHCEALAREPARLVPDASGRGTPTAD